MDVEKGLNLGTQAASRKGAGLLSGKRSAATVPYSISPYLNIDPSILAQQEPEFIIPEGQNARRSRHEQALPIIGSFIFSGAGAGSAYGLYKGFTDQNVKQLEGKYFNSPWRTQFINVVTRHASTVARTGGTIGMFYCGIGSILNAFTSQDQIVISAASGAATGALYKSFSGLRQAAISSAVGTGVALGVYFLTNTKQVKKAVYQSRSYF